MDKKYFIKSSLFIIICILVLFFYTSVNLPLTCQEECNFSITKVENLRSIANRLRDEKYISSSILFQFYVKTKGLEKNIKAGDYPFTPIRDESLTGLSLIHISEPTRR